MRGRGTEGRVAQDYHGPDKRASGHRAATRESSLDLVTPKPVMSITIISLNKSLFQKTTIHKFSLARKGSLNMHFLCFDRRPVPYTVKQLTLSSVSDI